MIKNFLKGIILSLFITLFAANVALAAETEFSYELKTRLTNAIVLYIGSPKAFVNNIQSNIDAGNALVCPFIKNDRTLVPVRFISEGFGARVDWDESTETVLVTLNSTTVELKIGSNIMKINGKNQVIDVPAEIINDRTFIPLRALSEGLGKSVFWDDRGIVVISNNTSIFDVQNDKTLVDEIAYKYTGAEKSISIPGNGTMTFTLPQNWNFVTDASSENSIEFIIKPTDNNTFVCLNGILWNPDDSSSVSLERVKTVIENQGQELLPEAVETTLNVQEIFGDSVRGYYFTLEDKVVEPDGYKYIIVTDVVIGNVVVDSIFLSNERNSSNETMYMDMIRKISLKK